MIRALLTVIGVLGSLLTLASASAAPSEAFRIGDWIGSIHRDARTREFKDCTARMTSADNLTIIYSLDRNYVWSFELSNPNWRFARGASFQIILKLNKSETTGHRAYALSSDLVRVRFPDGLDAFTKLSRALQLDAAVGGLTFRFNLSYGPDVLVALTQCVARHNLSSRRVKDLNHVARAKSDAPLDLTAGNEARALAAKIIKLMGVRGAKLTPDSEIPSHLKADTFWKVGPLLFGVTTLASEQASELNSLPAGIIGRDSQSCRGGSFFAGASFQRSDLLKGSDAPHAARAYTFCQIPGNRISTFYIAAPRKPSGVYLFSIIGQGSEFSPAIEDAAKNFDDGVLSVLASALK